ncbi:MAG: hypothetical protein ACI8QD_002503 [Cyclobacteriaceae bacterium]|jgi:hypothetical protein
MNRLLSTFFALAFSLLLVVKLNAQPVPENIGVNSTMNAFSNGSDPNRYALMGRKLPPSPTEGNPFYVYGWSETDFELENNLMISDQSAMYDIEKNIFYLIAGEGDIRAMDGKKVTAFSWVNSESGIAEKFVNARWFDSKDILNFGFLKIDTEDEVSLLIKRITKIRKADYVEGIAAGRNFDEIRKEDLHILRYQNRIVPITGKLKKDQDSINDLGFDLDIKAFQKKQKINLKTIQGVRVLQQQLNLMASS